MNSRDCRIFRDAILNLKYVDGSCFFPDSEILDEFYEKIVSKIEIGLYRSLKELVEDFEHLGGELYRSKELDESKFKFFVNALKEVEKNIGNQSAQADENDMDKMFQNIAEVGLSKLETLPFSSSLLTFLELGKNHGKEFNKIILIPQKKRKLKSEQLRALSTKRKRTTKAKKVTGEGDIAITSNNTTIALPSTTKKGGKYLSQTGEVKKQFII